MRAEFYVPRLEWEVGAELGEGPLWLEPEQVLLFTDIKAGRVHRFDPTTGQKISYAVGGKPSFIVSAEHDTLLVGDRDAVRPLVAGQLDEPFLRIPMPGHNRTNDATVDHVGRLWFGTMDDEERRPTGSLYCLQHGSLRQTKVHAAVTNGLR